MLINKMLYLKMSVSATHLIFISKNDVSSFYGKNSSYASHTSFTNATEDFCLLAK